MRKLLVVLSSLAAIAAPAYAQSHAGFSGKWALSQGRSDFGGGDALTSRTDTITLNGNVFIDEIHSTSDGSDDTYQMTLATDGKPVAVPDDSPLASVGIMTMTEMSAEWKGNSLVIIETLTSSFIPGTSQGTMTYSLAPDGKLMSITSTSDAPFGATTTRLVFEKI